MSNRHQPCFLFYVVKTFLFSFCLFFWLVFFFFFDNTSDTHNWDKSININTQNSIQIKTKAGQEVDVTSWFHKMFLLDLGASEHKPASAARRCSHVVSTNPRQRPSSVGTPRTAAWCCLKRRRQTEARGALKPSRGSRRLKAKPALWQVVISSVCVFNLHPLSVCKSKHIQPPVPAAAPCGRDALCAWGGRWLRWSSSAPPDPLWCQLNLGFRNEGGTNQSSVLPHRQSGIKLTRPACFTFLQWDPQQVAATCHPIITSHPSCRGRLISKWTLCIFLLRKGQSFEYWIDFIWRWMNSSPSMLTDKEDSCEKVEFFTFP